MRRLVKHGIAGVGFCAFTVTAAVAALGSPAGQDTAIAVPAPAVVISAPAVEPVDATLAAEQAARSARESRDAQRAALTATATTQADKRATTLTKQNKAITAQQTKIKTARAKAKAAAEAKARAEAKAKALVIKNQGYEPGTTDPREMARQILKNKYGYGANQYSCFNYIIMRESMWKVNAENKSSGAYGIPQALPGSKMASVGSDWRTNPATQITWGIEYMKKRYGSPCEAKVFKASHGWY
ncbi:MAG TPA: transglycosylase SLT domain-containing protein [Propionibacteriaceae bacterium]